MSDYQKPLVTIELAEYQTMIKMLETYENSFGIQPIQDLFERVLGVLMLSPHYNSHTFELTVKQWYSREELFPILNEMLTKSNFSFTEDHANKKVKIKQK